MATPNKPVVKSFNSPFTTPSSAGKPISSALKERLKRSGRYHASPISTKKSRTCVSDVSSTSSEDVNQLDAQIVVTCTDVVNDATSVTSTNNGDTDVICNTKTNDVQNNEMLDVHVTSTIRNNTDNLASAIQTNVKQIYQNTEENEHNIREKVVRNVDDIADVNRRNCDEKEDEQKLDDRDVNNLRTKVAKTKLKFNVKEKDVSERKEKLIEIAKEKRESLRKLNLVKMYREKNNLAEVTRLTETWRLACQTAVQDLHARLDQPNSTLTDLIQNLNLDMELIRFDADEDAFF